MKLKLDPMKAKSPRFSHMYNQFIQAWNTVFFLCAAAGGAYLCARTEFIEFNPQFTFDNFVVGSSNRFAHAAAVSVANNPAETYNPLFIYGPSGLGKTHLLYAIASVVHKNHPSYNIVYIKGDQFTNELIAALQEGRNNEFRNKYRNADLFLVDDIQFIAGKESTQEEFFHTFNNLYENHHQIVLTADRPPNEMLRLEDRLKTRFEWGLIADIQPPDFETRMAIIKNKSVSLGFELPDDVCTFIAENVTSNVRLLEGTVKKIRAYHDLDNMELTVPNVSRAIKDMYNKEKAGLNTDEIDYQMAVIAGLTLQAAKRDAKAAKAVFDLLGEDSHSEEAAVR